VGFGSSGDDLGGPVSVDCGRDREELAVGGELLAQAERGTEEPVVNRKERCGG